MVIFRNNKFSFFLIFFLLILFQFEYRIQLEALKLKKKEERELKEAGNKRAKEIAEQNYRVSVFLNIHISKLLKKCLEHF